MTWEKTQNAYSIIQCWCLFFLWLFQEWEMFCCCCCAAKILTVERNSCIFPSSQLLPLSVDMQAHQLASATTFTSVVANQGSEICTCYVARFERKACNTSTAHGILCSPGWVKRWRHSRRWGDRLPFALLGCIGVKLQQLIFHGQVVTQLRNLCRGEKKAVRI